MTLQFEGVGFNAGPGGGGKTGTVVLVAMGSQPSTPYTVGSKWFYNGKIYTATTTTAHDSGVVPSYDTAYLYNGTYYYWDGSALQGADESNLVHITGTETITGNKSFTGTNNLGDATSATTQPTSDTSDKVATTQFVKDYAEEGEWQKPADWVDIRSGALPNSIYFLAAHSKPVESGGVYSITYYPKISFYVALEEAATTYDVFVDGIKITTHTTGIITTIDWADLYNQGILEGGYDIASPGGNTYTTHIIRIAPSNSNDVFKQIRIMAISGQQYQGALWAHLELSNAIDIHYLVSSSSVTNALVQAITAKDDKIIYRVYASGDTGLLGMCMNASALQKIPKLEAENNINGGGTYSAFSTVPAKKITIKNNSEKLSMSIIHGFLGEHFEIENPVMLSGALAVNSASAITRAHNLKKLPNISMVEKGETILLEELENLDATFIDESFNDIRTCFRAIGTADKKMNIVGLVVSNSAPFNYATAPQLSVKYTNMNRVSLVRLFNSMPTVSDGQEIDVTGAIGAGDLTADDIAIVTGKGWTLTR